MLHLYIYASCGKISDAVLLFDKMPHRMLLISWKTMTIHLVKRGDMGLAHRMFIQMPKSIPVHEYQIRNGFKIIIFICNALIGTYIRCGCLEVACECVSWHEGIEDMRLRAWMDPEFCLGGEILHKVKILKIL